MKVISGGQTGVDRAALDVAIDLGLEHGGHCPAKRRAEDGRIPDRYVLTETVDRGYGTRTRRNVFVADKTLVITRGLLTPGSALTTRYAAQGDLPCRHLDLTGPYSPEAFEDLRAWVRCDVLNVAGSRESRSPGIYAITYRLLFALLRPIKRGTLRP